MQHIPQFQIELQKDAERALSMLPKKLREALAESAATQTFRNFQDSGKLQHKQIVSPGVSVEIAIEWSPEIRSLAGVA